MENVVGFYRYGAKSVNELNSSSFGRYVFKLKINTDYNGYSNGFVEESFLYRNGYSFLKVVVIIVNFN